MTIEALTKLIELLRANGVTRFKDDALDIRLAPMAQEMTAVTAMSTVSKGPALQAIPPVETEIPHHVNEVLGLLKLSDEDLVEKMWPEPKGEAI
jgi:hypothetical protein